MRQALRFLSGAGVLSLLVLCFKAEISAGQDEGKRMTSYMTASQVLSIAGRAYPEGGSTGMALALPFAAKGNSGLQIVVLFYRESVRKGEERMYPPHHLVAVDPRSGRVLRNEPCTPKTFGLGQAAGVPVEGFGLDPRMSAEVFWKKHDRFMEISPAVWQSYASAASHLPKESTQVVREYFAIFNMIAKKPLLPYYRAVAPDFLKWLEGAAQ